MTSVMGGGKVDVRIDASERDAMIGWFSWDDHWVEFSTNVVWEDDKMVLTQFHLQGDLKNRLGHNALLRAIKAFMEQQGVTHLSLQGGERKTGTATGPAGRGPRKPRPMEFRLEEGRLVRVLHP